MIEVLAWVAAAFLVAMILLTIGIVGFRFAGPHSKKMAQEQEKLNRKAGAPAPQPAAAGAAAAGGPGQLESFAKYAWPLLFVVAAVFLVWWLRGVSIHALSHSWSSNLEAPSLATVGMFFRTYWLWLLVSIAILYFALGWSSNPTTAKRAQTLLSFIVVLLASAALWSWLAGPSVYTGRTAATPSRICPNVSSRATATCLVTDSTWSNWVQFADGSRDDGKQICFPFGVEFEKKQDGLTTMWRFRAKEGTVLFKYRLFSSTADCATVTM